MTPIARTLVPEREARASIPRLIKEAMNVSKHPGPEARCKLVNPDVDADGAADGQRSGRVDVTWWRHSIH